MVCISRPRPAEAHAESPRPVPSLPCWSPDGSTIAVALFVSGKILFLNRVERSSAPSLCGNARLDMGPGLVVDNGRLLFVADDDQRRPAIWTIRPDEAINEGADHDDRDSRRRVGRAAGDAFYYFRRVNQTVSLYKASLDRDRTNRPRADTAHQRS